MPTPPSSTVSARRILSALWLVSVLFPSPSTTFAPVSQSTRSRAPAFGVRQQLASSVDSGSQILAASRAATTLYHCLKSTGLRMAAGERGSSSQRKRKRRRKAPSQPPAGTAAPDPIKVERERLEGLEPQYDDDEEDDADDFAALENTADVDSVKEELLLIKDVAKFEFKPDSDVMVGMQDEGAADAMRAASAAFPGVGTPAADVPNDAIPLPDIRESRLKKKLEEEMQRQEEEKEETRVKIKRSDKEAFRKLLEQQPFADADESYFEEEAYDNVSALLGERAKPFLGIPVGPLQVGHFVGALGIVLMAFVEYPGFPLTNLPTPLRDALQGGLATVYAINALLAVGATFKAKERGQPSLLWAAKTLSVGGLAFDQLTQLPTQEELERAKARKGKRALKSKKSSR